MASFENPKHKKKKIQNVHNNILEHKTHFELKLGLIQWLNEKDWIKSMCIKYIINVHFFNDHRVSCLLFMTHYQTKEK